jgi:hypothetical protein
MRRSRSGRSERHAGACPVPPFPPSRSSRRRRAGPLRRSHYWQTESQLAGNVMKVATLTLGGVRGRRGCAVRWTPSSSRAVSCPSAARLRLCRATASVPCRVCVARRSRPWHNERRLRDACRERAPRVSEPRAGLSFRSLPRCAGTKREQLAPASDGKRHARRESAPSRSRPRHRRSAPSSRPVRRPVGRGSRPFTRIRPSNRRALHECAKSLGCFPTLLSHPPSSRASRLQPESRRIERCTASRNAFSRGSSNMWNSMLFIT